MLKYYRHFVPDEQDLTFYLCTHRDLELLEICLVGLRDVYVKSRVIVVSDGDPNPKIAMICEQFGCEFHKGEWLYGLTHGGQRIHRMLELFFNKPSRFLVKIDTDTRIVRPFAKCFPDRSCVFGGLGQSEDHRFIQGGCIIYHIDAARALYESEIFMESCLIDNPCQWAYYDSSFWRIENGYISEDQLNAHCIKNIGIPMLNHSEVKSYSSDGIGLVKARILLELNPAGVAVVHPCKSKMSVW